MQSSIHDKKVPSARAVIAAFIARLSRTRRAPNDKAQV